VRTRILLLAILFGMTAFCPCLRAEQDKIAEMQGRFDRESNSVRRVKLFEKLGDEQLARTRTVSTADDYRTVAQILETYRNNARIALDSLRKQHPNAEKQLSGYKQLQMHIYKGLREVDEMLLVFPADLRPPLQLVREDLLTMDQELLHSIFPHRPTKPSNKDAPLPDAPSQEKP
jgi:hypothetical protein